MGYFFVLMGFPVVTFGIGFLWGRNFEMRRWRREPKLMRRL